MAKLLTDLFYTALDLNGTPLSGAKLEFFVTGTSTPLAIYTDDALAVAHSNPVIADSAGRFAPIYLQNLDYKAILSTSADVVIDTVDPVHGANANDVLVKSTGSTTARLLSERMADIINVKDYGAKGDLTSALDGVTTDGSAVLTSAGAAFATDDVGKTIMVRGAATTGVTVIGAANGPADAVWQEDSTGAPSYVDLTSAFNDAAAGDVNPFPAVETVTDRFIIGHVQQFSKVTITIGTQGVGGTVTWKYWNGSAWTALSGVTDGTSGFTAVAGSHDLTFTVPGDWVENTVNGSEAFYIAAELTGVYSTNPVLDQGVLDGGRIRITATAHGFASENTIGIKNVTGTTEANGLWTVTVADADNFDLRTGVFANTYISGGTAHESLKTTIASVESATSLTMAANAGITGTALSYAYGTDDTAAIQAALNAANTAFMLAGNYLISSTLVVRAEKHLLGEAPNVVTITLADNSDVTMLETFKFDTLKAASAFELEDDSDYTFGYGIWNIIFDGNFDNQAPSGLIYGLRLYGRRWVMQSVQIANIKGIGLWTLSLGTHTTFDSTDTDTPGYIDDVYIINTLDESWIYQGPQHIRVGTLQTNGCGDTALSMPAQTSRFPDWIGDPVHSIVGGVGLRATHFNLNNARFGRGLSVRTGLRVEIDSMVLAGNWGGVLVASNCFGKFGQIVSQANPHAWGGVAQPHIQNAAQDVQYQSVIISRVSGQDSAAPGVKDTGGAQFSQILSRNADGTPGHGAVISGTRSRIDDILLEGMRGTADDGNPSVGVRIDSGASNVRVVGTLANCDVGVKNNINGLDGTFDLFIQQDVTRGDVNLEGFTGGTALSDYSLKKARIHVQQNNPNAEKDNAFHGSLTFDSTLTTNQDKVFTHNMFRTPDISEISLSWHVEAATKPTIDYLFVSSITSTQVTVSIKMATASVTPTTESIGIQING